MNLLTNIANTPSTDSRTLDQKKEQCANRMKSIAQQQYTQLCRMQKEGINMVWDNPSGLNPQEVCDSVENKASVLFTIHGALTEGIAAIAAATGITPDISLPTKAFTKNADGTVTVLDTAYGE